MADARAHKQGSIPRRAWRWLLRAIGDAGALGVMSRSFGAGGGHEFGIDKYTATAVLLDQAPRSDRDPDGVPEETPRRWGEPARAGQRPRLIAEAARISSMASGFSRALRSPGSSPR